jgi:hypothetical protein
LRLFICACPVGRPCRLLQLRPALAEWVLERTKLLKWLLTRIRVKASDSNKQYASEILSILVQVSAQDHHMMLQRGRRKIDTLFGSGGVRVAAGHPVASYALCFLLFDCSLCCMCSG